jgi:hypothetical protein
MGADEDIIGMIIRRDSYNILKKQMQGGDPNYVTSPSQHLLAAAEASESNASPSFMFVACTVR